MRAGSPGDRRRGSALRVAGLRVACPEGFVLVKINKQLYLVPKEQLPALFTQTNSLRVQVI